jgi:LPXTG-motif cell wall-anchored protein
VKRQSSNTDRSEQVLDFSLITVKVYDADDGLGLGGRVVFSIPAELMPVYYPEIYGEFYYEELPVRLIYRVGLTDETIEKIAKQLSDSPAEVYYTYYTNEWDEDHSEDPTTTVTFELAESDDGYVNEYYVPTDEAAYNTEYGDDWYDKKASNPTETSYVEEDDDTYGIRFTEYCDEDEGDHPTVYQFLGNNGRITFDREDLQAVTISKVWPNGVPSGTTSATFEFYYKGSDGTISKVPKDLTVGSASALDGTDVTTWETFLDLSDYEDELKEATNYYVRETSIPQGYVAGYMQGSRKLEPTTITYNGNTLTVYEFNYDNPFATNVTVTNSQAYTLPAAGGTGTYMYTLGGVALVLLSTYALYMLVKRREKTPAKGVKNGDFYW